MQEHLTTLTLYKWDNTIFDNFRIPAGLDKELLVENLLLETAELNVILTRPDVLGLFIERWSKRRLPVWEKLYKTTQLEYNPIENYRRDDTWEETENRNSSDEENFRRGIDKNALQTRDLKGTSDENRGITGTNDETRDLRVGVSETHELSDSETEVTDFTDNLNIDKTKNDTETHTKNWEEEWLETRNLRGTSDTDREFSSGSEGTHVTTITDDFTRNLGTSGQHNGSLGGSDQTDHFEAAFNDTSSAKLAYYDVTKYGKTDSSTDTGTETGTTKNVRQENGSTTTASDENENVSGNTTDTGTIKQDGTHIETDTDTIDITENEKQKDTQNTQRTNEQQHGIGIEKETLDTGTDKFKTTEDMTDAVRTTDTGTIKNDEGIEEEYNKGNEHTDDRYLKHTQLAHGNIGVTTTQKMIQEEREIDEFDIYEYIINDYKNEFCVMVY